MHDLGQGLIIKTYLVTGLKSGRYRTFISDHYNAESSRIRIVNPFFTTSLRSTQYGDLNYFFNYLFNFFLKNWESHQCRVNRFFRVRKIRKSRKKSIIRFWRKYILFSTRLSSTCDMTPRKWCQFDLKILDNFFN